MTTINTEQQQQQQQRRDARRAYLRSLKRGDMIQCALPMQSMLMKFGGRMVDVTPAREPAELEAERKAKADAEWREYWWRNSS
jgi:hypothetical protein